MRMLKMIILLLIGSAAWNLSAKPKMKSMQVRVEGVGLVKIQYDELGEPISEPARVELFVTCENTKKTRRFKVYRMCEWTDYSYEADIKTLNFKFIAGRVEFDTGDVHCDQVDDIHVDASDICKSP